jgi:hypothetical protein
LPAAKSISPPQAESNGNSGILPLPFGRNPAYLPFSPSGFCEAKTREIYSRRHPCL